MLQTQIDESLLLLEKDKQNIREVFLAWMDFLKIPQEDMKVKHVEEIFDKVLTKMNVIKLTLRDDLEKDYDSFLEFFKVGVDNALDCYKEIQSLIFFMKEIYEEDDGMDKDDSSLENLVKIADKLHFLRFQKSVFTFYQNMSALLDDVLDYADKLYVHHTGDTSLCGTKNQ